MRDVVLVAALATSVLSAQDPPRVERLEPARGDVEVPPDTTELVVTFDRSMSQNGWSFCGGGPSYPKAVRVHWKNARTCVMEVELEPDHSYALSLNCPAASNFRSAAGVPLSPVPWRFHTLPEELPPQREQRKENARALAQLLDVLESGYSYYDHCGVSWSRQLREHRRDILTAKTTRGWAAAVAEMLEPAGDIHLSLRYGDDTFATGRRAVDPLFRRPLLQRYLAEVDDVAPHVLAGRTEDGIGYLLVASWSNDLDTDAIERALAAMRDTEALVVDVRPNSGGNELKAQEVARWFVAGERVYAKNRYRQRKGKDGFGPVLDRAITGNGPERRFPGRVAVLQSRYVMSSNEAFVLMMRQGERVTTVGQTTYGSSGNPKPHELDNGVVAVVPSWQALRPDGTCFEKEGIAPDVVVEVDPSELDERDPILERALELLRDGG